ncbi:putative cytochrome b5 reductase 4 [Triangularia setosa]|uniref:Cytochrome b5 reductase 4 n=1 Tax=Triangularia setosa TaxID=2587417 RepID=A0AAN6WID8_9PEZI|nr:putative cytochrome b5 reductase 4 [Podospora setosa]
MALLGVTLIIASLILLCMRRPQWLPSLFGGAAPQRDTQEEKPANGLQSRHAAPPALVVQQPHDANDNNDEDDGQSTPKASATLVVDSAPVPILALSEPEPESAPKPKIRPLPPPVPLFSAAPTTAAASPSNNLMMPPPPRPPTLRPTPSLSSSLAPAPSRLSPAPARGPGCSTLAPPPTHSTKPSKPSKAVVLTPGHSPLDWARLSGNPSADLRGLPTGTPYLRVTPTMLKRQTGRRGKDAWTVLSGKVYNLTPYLPFHPGGEPELLRCAGRDGTRLFGEIHPWVNYEGMLGACLVGIFVTEEEAAAAAAGAGGMEDMD